MDLNFFRALSNLGDNSSPVCILRRNKDLLVCTDLSQSANDPTELRQATFATGWFSASGEMGRWHTWNSVEHIANGARVPASAKDSTSAMDSLFRQSDAWSSSLDEDDFVSTIETMKEDMARGEYFLANLTRMLDRTGTFDGTFIALLSCLIHDSPFRFFHRDERRTIIGLSPERFIRVENNTVSTEPMKGTGGHIDDLINNAKEHDENTMMIDLVRSDLSRICDATSIAVDQRELFSTHPGLIQMSSVLSGKLSTDLIDAIVSMMPIASVTGTPKPYVVKKIAQYEKFERDIYCGTYGWIDIQSQECDLAVGIRTIVVDDDGAHIGTGAGITIQSDPIQEWKETELKASRLTSLVDQSMPSDTLDVQTSLAINESGQTFLLEQHCARLARHSFLAGHGVEASDILQRAHDYLRDTKPVSARLRIAITDKDQIECTTEPFDRSVKPITLGFAPAPHIDGEVPKYLDRTMYDRAFAWARVLASSEIDDAFLVVDGKITETTRANFFIRQGESVVTPPLNGIIHGIGRAHTMSYLSQQGIPVLTKTLSLADVIGADEIITTNSVRGPLRVAKLSGVLLDEDITLTESNNSLLTWAREAFEKGFD